MTALMHDLSERLAHRVQLTTDGHKVYLEAVESAFNLDVDYAMLQKVYGADPDAARRYSPASIQVGLVDAWPRHGLPLLPRAPRYPMAFLRFAQYAFIRLPIAAFSAAVHWRRFFCFAFGRACFD